MRSNGVIFFIELLKEKIQNNDRLIMSTAAAAVDMPRAILGIIDGYIGQNMAILDILLGGVKETVIESKVIVHYYDGDRYESNIYSYMIREFTPECFQTHRPGYITIRLGPPMKIRGEYPWCPCLFERLFELSDLCRFNCEFRDFNFYNSLRLSLMEKVAQ